MSLSEYNKKRNFKNTSEPKGIKKNSKKELIFVIQYHRARAIHYDFRLEFNNVLLSFAVPKGLSFDPKTKRLAVHVEDHPLDYASFEGIIPKGNYGAGTVEIYDNGTYIPLNDFKTGLKQGHLKFVLNGKKYNGVWSLVRTDNSNWIIVKGNDNFARKEEDLKIKHNPFNSCEVMLATIKDKVPKGKDWIFEIKYDGYRMLAFYDNKKVKLVSRNNTDYTLKFKKICESIKKIKCDCFVLDGEVVCFDENGKTDFSLLQSNIKSKIDNMCYVVFDLLSVNGEDIRLLPLSERKKKLELLLSKTESNIIFSKHILGNGNECFDFAKKHELEGVIAKKVNSHYIGKRSEDWLKIKCYHRQEFVICGYTTSQQNPDLSSLILGYYKNNALTFVGKVGTGFNQKNKDELLKIFKKNKTSKCPFAILPTIKNINWLKPVYVAEIKFANLTKDSLLRQPSFVGLRKDKNAKQVFLENVNEN